MTNQLVVLTGLTCDACTRLIVRKFMRIPGVVSTRVELNGHAIVQADREITGEEFAQSLTGLPYQIESIQ